MTDPGRTATATRRRPARPPVDWTQLRKPAVFAVFLAAFVLSAVWQATLNGLSTHDSVVATAFLAVFGAILVGLVLSLDARRRRR